MIKKSFFSDKLTPYQGKLFQLSFFLGNLSLRQGKINDLIYSLAQSVNILKELVPLETFQGSSSRWKRLHRQVAFLAV